MSKATLTARRVLTYDHALWTGAGRWRGAVAVVLLIGGFFAVSTLITTGGALLDSALGGVPTGGAPAVTPIGLLTINLSIIAL